MKITTCDRCGKEMEPIYNARIERKEGRRIYRIGIKVWNFLESEEGRDPDNGGTYRDCDLCHECVEAVVREGALK